MKTDLHLDFKLEQTEIGQCCMDLHQGQKAELPVLFKVEELEDDFVPLFFVSVLNNLFVMF